MCEHVLAFWKQEIEKIRYRIYVTDSLRILGENAAKMVGGSYITERYADKLIPQKADHRSGDEIAVEVILRAGLKLREEVEAEDG